MLVKQPKLYVLAMYAMKLDPERVEFAPQPDGSVEWELKETLDKGAGIFPAVSLWAVGAVAHSEEQARDAAMQRLLAERPWQEGWVNHRVTINALPRDVLLRAVSQLAEEAADEGDQEESPELIM